MSKYWIVLALIFGNWPSMEGCTGLRLKAKDGALVHGRTLEFGNPLSFSFGIVPKNYPCLGTTPSGTGLSYKTKYGAVGAFVFDIPALMDGLNEKGLAIGTFFFPGYAEYATITPDNQSKALSPVEFPHWVLTQFATIDQVKAALDQVVIAPTQIQGWGSQPPPFHYIVYDRSGGCLVIEPLQGKLVASNNPLGVLTNSPTFDWHLTNLHNYINLRAVNVPPLNIEGLELFPFGQGSGMVGLPGDFTPPSRFVRATLFSYTAFPAANGNEAISQLFHLLNNFDIPLGSVRDVQQKTVHADYTMVTCARDPQNLKYFFKTYSNQTIQMIDLNRFDLNGKTIKRLTPSGPTPIQDVSDKVM